MEEFRKWLETKTARTLLERGNSVSLAEAAFNASAAAQLAACAEYVRMHESITKSIDPFVVDVIATDDEDGYCNALADALLAEFGGKHDYDAHIAALQRAGGDR